MPRGDPWPPASFNSVIQTDDHRLFGCQTCDQQRQKASRRLARLPTGPIEDLMIASETGALGTTGHAQTSGDGAFARCQHAPITGTRTCSQLGALKTPRKGASHRRRRSGAGSPSVEAERAIKHVIATFESTAARSTRRSACGGLIHQEVAKRFDRLVMLPDAAVFVQSRA